MQEEKDRSYMQQALALAHEAADLGEVPIGAVVVQHIEAFGTEFYLQYRYFTLDRDIDPHVHDINLGSIGARVKF